MCKLRTWSAKIAACFSKRVNFDLLIRQKGFPSINFVTRVSEIGLVGIMHSWRYFFAAVSGRFGRFPDPSRHGREPKKTLLPLRGRIKLIKGRFINFRNNIYILYSSSNVKNV